ncbi:hypothetical protein Pse7367_0968 [Thalassoporum mexicanum PCC 7367]|nr:hypothetical protein Pse7367_0968 [Pseudanabaena sp. PCC 7367]
MPTPNMRLWRITPVYSNAEMCQMQSKDAAHNQATLKQRRHPQTTGIARITF